MNKVEKINLKNHVLIDFDKQYTNYDLSKIPTILDKFNSNKYTNFGMLYNDHYITLDVNADDFIRPTNVVAFTITDLMFEDNKIIGELEFSNSTACEFYVTFVALMNDFDFEFDICGDFKNDCINDIENFVIKFKDGKDII